MLQISESSVFGATKLYLEARQLEIDNLLGYPERVEKAQTSWSGKNTAVFKILRGLLSELCSGAIRCQYCEDSAADEVEHIWPKKFYPNKAFVWENYLFSCGPCNGSHKSDKFSIFDPLGQVVILVRKPKTVPIMPVAGNSVFLNPRIEDPFDFIELDLTTGIFLPIDPPGSQNYVRAEYTISTLGLNKRDYLIKARKNAYASYLASAFQYVVRKTQGAPAIEMKQLAHDISNRHHGTVWAEMKRLSTAPAHAAIFQAAPELLTY